MANLKLAIPFVFAVIFVSAFFSFPPEPMYELTHCCETAEVTVQKVACCSTITISACCSLRDVAQASFNLHIGQQVVDSTGWQSLYAFTICEAIFQPPKAV